MQFSIFLCLSVLYSIESYFNCFESTYSNIKNIKALSLFPFSQRIIDCILSDKSCNKKNLRDFPSICSNIKQQIKKHIYEDNREEEVKEVPKQEEIILEENKGVEEEKKESEKEIKGKKEIKEIEVEESVWDSGEVRW
jgi:hypothetical protein